MFVVEINFNVFTHQSSKKNPLAHRFSQSLTVWEDMDGFFLHCNNITNSRRQNTLCHVNLKQIRI